MDIENVTKEELVQTMADLLAVVGLKDIEHFYDTIDTLELVSVGWLLAKYESLDNINKLNERLGSATWGEALDLYLEQRSEVH